MKIIVPMAGRGSRFAEVADTNPAYQVPKPLIDVKGRPMVAWALESLKKLKFKSQDLIFICQQQHQDKYGVATSLKNIFGSDIKVVLIPEVTRGAVETVLIAKNHVDPKEEIIISDSDHFFDGTNLINEIKNNGDKVDGIIPVFKVADKDPKWSYTLTDKDNYALAVGEKDESLAAKGAYANIGAYYFAKSEVFYAVAEEAVSLNEVYGAEGKKEFYVAPMYQRLLDKGMRIKVAVISEVWGLGTPKDLENFLTKYRR